MRIVAIATLTLVVICTANCASGPSAQDTMHNEFARQAAQATERERAFSERLETQKAAIHAALVPYFTCIKRRAVELALEPEAAETLARASLAGCGKLRSEWTKAARDARDIFDVSRAQAYINTGEDGFRDAALGIIVDLRRRARDAPQPAPSIQNRDGI